MDNVDVDVKLTDDGKVLIVGWLFGEPFTICEMAWPTDKMTTIKFEDPESFRQVMLERARDIVHAVELWQVVKRIASR